MDPADSPAPRAWSPQYDKRIMEVIRQRQEQETLRKSRVRAVQSVKPEPTFSDIIFEEVRRGSPLKETCRVVAPWAEDDFDSYDTFLTMERPGHEATTMERAEQTAKMRPTGSHDEERRSVNTPSSGFEPPPDRMSLSVENPGRDDDGPWEDAAYPPPSGLPRTMKRRRFSDISRGTPGDGDERDVRRLSPSTSESSFSFGNMSTSHGSGSVPRAWNEGNSSSSERPTSLWIKHQIDKSEQYRLNFRIVQALKMDSQELIARRRWLQREVDALDSVMEMSPRKKQRHMSMYGEPGEVCAEEE